VLNVALLVLLVAMSLAVLRAIRGPTVFDRILASNSFSTLTVLLVCLLGFLSEHPEDYIDIALLYAIIGFIASVAVLKWVELGNLGRLRPRSESTEESP
jgi:multicomponent Na+:H+ antiporter subunit F